jgi:hypothetical protein
MKREALAGLFVTATAVAALAAPLLNPKWGVIFPPYHARSLLSQCSRGVPKADGTWAPDQKQIAALEEGLVAALAVADAAQNYKRDIAHTARQYGGITIAGSKRIYVNGFPNQMDSGDWRNRAIVICDGGPAFFGVEYDPANRTFTGFSFNGVA